MINPQQFERIVRALPFLESSDPGLLREFQEKVFFARIPEGRDIFVEGDLVDAIALMISGVVRVYKIGETGREITLYRFGNGESCILTANAILSQKNFPAVATVEKEAEAIMIPAETFRDWVRRYDIWREFVFEMLSQRLSAVATVEKEAEAIMVPADTFREWVRRYDIWREFVFELLSQRLSAVMAIVEEVAFRRMDVRLAALLSERSRGSDLIQITHQEIAAELGSSREVISRILEDFSAQGTVEVSRGSVKVLDREALKERSVV